MRGTYYPGVFTTPGTYYQGWFVYMRYTQGQNEEYLLSRSMYYTRYLLTKSHYISSHSLHSMLYIYDQIQYTRLLWSFEMRLIDS